MRSWQLMPGVPAAGHVTAGGWWHPGRSDGCVKCQPQCDHRGARSVLYGTASSYYCDTCRRQVALPAQGSTR